MPSWGSTNRSSHSCFKSVPKMEKKKKVTLSFGDGTTLDSYVGYGSPARQEIKKMHKKKRRQIFKNDLKYDGDSL